MAHTRKGRQAKRIRKQNADFRNSGAKEIVDDELNNWNPFRQTSEEFYINKYTEHLRIAENLLFQSASYNLHLEVANKYYEKYLEKQNDLHYSTDL